MSAFQRLSKIIEFCRVNTNHKTSDMMLGFHEYFELNGYLTDKQMVTLNNVVRQVHSNFQLVESFEKQLGEFLKEPEVKKVFKLIS